MFRSYAIYTHPSPNQVSPAKTVAVIGAGPAGLMAAEVLSQAGLKVDVYDAMPSVGRKFLMAGKGGLNITHAEAYGQFLSRYGVHSTDLKPLLDAFTPTDLCAWVHDLGISTFVGSSGKVFPKEMKAAPLLRAWLHRLRMAGVKFHVRHQWTGWADTDTKHLRFVAPNGEYTVAADAVVLALGGASWPQLGSTGAWVQILAEQGLVIAPLKPANCGFEVAWSAFFQERYAGQPLKSVCVAFTPADGAALSRAGELMITQHGLEGGALYGLSAVLRDTIAAQGAALIHLDLCPDQSVAQLSRQLALARGKLSLANHLRKRVGLTGAKAALAREQLPADYFNQPEQLAAALKALPIRLAATRPIAEAISTAGGIPFAALSPQLMLHALPGVFCAGEMLDWEAPTGGYLLSACLASGRAAALGAVALLAART